MVKSKHVFSCYGKALKDGTNYRKYIIGNEKYSTEKQRKYLDDLLNTCSECGLDISWMPIDRSTKSGCRAAINAIYTVLDKNGYDNRGNKIKTYNLKDLEGAENGDK